LRFEVPFRFKPSTISNFQQFQTSNFKLQTSNVFHIFYIYQNKGGLMPRFVIERELPGAGKLSQEQLTAISQKSCDVLKGLGSGIQWLESFVTDDKIYCVYLATDKEIIRKHAEQGGFPANRIEEIRTVIGPATAEEKTLSEASQN